MEIQFPIRLLKHFSYPNILKSLVSFLDLPTIQFLITCNMQKQREKAWSIFIDHENDISVYSGGSRTLLLGGEAKVAGGV